MPTATIALNRKFDMPKAISVGAEGVSYARPPCTFSYSSNLVRTGFPDRMSNFYDSVGILVEMINRGEIPADTRFMLQPESYQIEQSHQRRGKDPTKADEFKDYFARNKGRWYASEWTANGLRAHEGWENDRADKGTGKYPRQIIETDISKVVKLLLEGATWEDIGDSVNSIVGERQFPIGGGDVIVESDDFDGLPVATKELPWPHKGYYAHWWLNPNPQLDKISGHYDVAVGRRRDWPHVVRGRCLDVDAYYGRSVSGLYVGFRPVRGSLPEIEKSVNQE